MHQASVMKLFNQYLKDKDFEKIQNSFIDSGNLSKTEYFINLSKVAKENGDEWSSFLFYLKAFIENYFVKFFNFFKTDLYSVDSLDLFGQLGVLLKTEFVIFFILVFFVYHFYFSLRNLGKVKKSLVIYLVSFFSVAFFLNQKIKIGLLKPQTAFLSSPSKVFPTGEVSGEKELFIIIASDNIFLKMINSKFDTFWVQREDTVVIN
jgi:hypothetical protein